MTTQVFTLYLQLGFYVWSSQLKQRRPKNLRSTKNYFCLLCDCCYAAQTQAVAVHIIRWAICISAFWLKNRVFNTYRLPIYHNASHLRVGAIIKIFFFFVIIHHCCIHLTLIFQRDSPKKIWTDWILKVNQCNLILCIYVVMLCIALAHQLPKRSYIRLSVVAWVQFQPESLCCVASLEFLLLHYSHQIKAKNKKCWYINRIYQQLVFWVCIGWKITFKINCANQQKWRSEKQSTTLRTERCQRQMRTQPKHRKEPTSSEHVSVCEHNTTPAWILTYTTPRGKSSCC